jgi:hypothetical protein
MRFSITLDNPLAGFAGGYGRDGESTATIVRQLVTSDDGVLLLSRLEAISEAVLARIPVAQRPTESQIDHLIIFAYRDSRVDVWINEPGIVLKVRPKRAMEVNQLVMYDDIADVEVARLRDLEVPDDAGYAIVFSVGWQKALLFDFSAIHPSLAGTPTSAEMPRLLGAAHAYLMFRSRFALSEQDWTTLTAQRWFPFVGLSHRLVEQMVHHLRAGWSVDDLLPEIVGHVRASLPLVRDFVISSAVFEGHRNVLLQALEAYGRGEYALAVAAMFPRVEGMLRDRIAAIGGSSTKYPALAQAAGSAVTNDYSLLMPGRFTAYLRDVFFASENFGDPSSVTKVTRHAVAHGVARDELLDEKAATLGVLIVHQIGFMLGTPKGADTSSVQSAQPSPSTP